VNREVSEDDLHAYVDNALDAARREEVEAYLWHRSEDAARVRAYIDQREALRAAFADRPSIPAPRNLNLLRLMEARIARRRASWRIAAAIALAFGFGGAAGWIGGGGLPTNRPERAVAVLIEEALASHAVYGADLRHPIEVQATERAHLTTWLSNRLNRRVEPPDLQTAGYELLGGRLLATERGRPAALFMYVDKQGQRVSVLVRPMAPDIRIKEVEAQSGQIGTCAWISDGLGYAVAGPLPEADLDRLADIIKMAPRAPS
jgi:anti-sigma factor RsiW